MKVSARCEMNSKKACPIVQYLIKVGFLAQNAKGKNMVTYRSQFL